jgi:hypothetical protein
MQVNKALWILLSVLTISCGVFPPECNDFNPEYCEDKLANYYHDTNPEYCGQDEIHQPNTNLCWRVCPADMYWDGDECQWNDPYWGPLTGSLELVTEDCKKLNPEYRLPTLTELANIAGCDLSVFNPYVTNYCEDFIFTIGNSIVYIRGLYSTDVWVGELELCGNSPDSLSYSCGWVFRLYGQETQNTEVDFLFATMSPGSAGARALCVREE